GHSRQRTERTGSRTPEYKACLVRTSSPSHTGWLQLDLRYFCRIFHIPRTAKPEPVHFRVGFGSVSLRRPYRRGAVNPASSTESFLRSFLRPLGIPVRCLFVVIGVVPVSRPFCDIAGHLKDSVGADGVLIFVDGNNRRIQQEPFRPVTHRAGQPRTAKVGPAQSCRLVAPWINASIFTSRCLLPFRRGR